MADARIYYMMIGTYRKYIEYRDVTVPYITVKIEGGGSSFQMVVAYNLKKVSAPQCSGCYDERTSTLAAVEYNSDSTYKVGYYGNKTSYGSQQSDPEVDLVVSWNNRFQEIRAYFDQIDPPKGQGTVTLEIPANGANLTFESALQSVSNTKFVSGDTEITITPTKKNVDITVNSVVGDVVTIKDRYGNIKATVNIVAT